RMEAVGFQHGDLDAKHVFVSADGASVYFLDWQRSRRGVVSPRQRIRDLAALDATLAEKLASEQERLACLEAYGEFWSVTQYSVLSTPKLADTVRRQSQRLLRRRHIREARLLPSAQTQELIWLDGEALCITPEFLEELQGDIPDWLRLERTPWDEEESLRCVVGLRDGRQRLLVRSRRDQPLRWLWNAFRGRPLRTAEARQAGILFRRQRQGLAASRLLAFGQRRPLPWRTESFLLT